MVCVIMNFKHTITKALKGGLSKMWYYCKKMFVPFFVYTLRAIAYRGGSFSIDMNVLTDKSGLRNFPVRELSVSDLTQ